MTQHDTYGESLFEPDPQGRMIFYGLGRIGYIVNAAKEKEVRAFLSNYYAWVVPLGALSAILGIRFTLLIPAGTLIGMVFWYRFQLDQILKGAAKSEYKRTTTYHQRISKQVAAESLLRLWLLEVFSLTFFGLAVWLVVSAPKFMIMGVISAVFCGLTSIAIGYMIAVKLQQKKQGG